MWIARDKNGSLGAYEKKPKKMEYFGFWYSTDNDRYFIDGLLFPEVKWEDKEPTEIIIKIKEL